MTSTHILRPIFRNTIRYLLQTQTATVYKTPPIALTTSRCINTTTCRMITVTNRASKDPKKPDETNESYEEALLKNDLELSSILSDILKDFDDSPPVKPTSGSKISSQSFEGDTIANDQENPAEYMIGKNSDEAKSSHEVSPGIQSKYQAYDQIEHQEILDAEEELEQPDFYLYQEKNNKMININLERGLKGVIDTEELVELLRGENMRDIVVMEIPKYLRYCNHMIVTTAMSTRHLKAVSEFLRKVHKMKKWNKDKFIPIEGETTDDWKVLDMGNVVVHLFLKETRDKYDLETLWTVGTEFDDLSQKVEDPLEDLLQQHIQYLDSVKMSSTA